MNRSRQSRGHRSATPSGPSTASPYSQALARLERARPAPPALQAAATALRAGNLHLARFECTTRLRDHPDDPDALYLLASVAIQQDRDAEAIPLLERCVAGAPDFGAARFELARMLFRSDLYERSLHEIDAHLRTDPENPLFLQYRAFVLERAGDAEGARDIFLRLSQKMPDHVDTLVRLGYMQRASGQAAQAVESLRRALSLRPSAGKAWWALADLKTFRFDDADVATLRQQIARAQTPADDRVAMEFALAKAMEDRADYARAYAHYAAGNAGLPRQSAASIGVLKANIARNQALFTREFLRAHEGMGHPSDEPIFILGRPRSGSTLIEQILASHSQVEGTSELRYLPGLAAGLADVPRAMLSTEHLPILATRTPEQLQALGAAYLDMARINRRQQRPRFIDKRPGNFLLVGMIRLVFPRARIIDARRHPMASCLSCFKIHNRAGGLSLAELGEYYRCYVELMDHFDAVAPGAVHRVIYEDLVQTPEAEIRRLLDYLGLPFEPACLRFYETPRNVFTPSSEQVRRPINADAMEHWRHFEPWLQPLKDALGPVLDDYRGAAR